MRRARLRLLIDACLSPSIPQHLADRFGDAVDAVHADRMLPPGAPDSAVVALGIVESRLIVTANEADSITLIREWPDHCGLGLVTNQDTRSRQAGSVERLAGALLRRIASGDAIAGRVFVWTRAGRLIVRRVP